MPRPVLAPALLLALAAHAAAQDASPPERPDAHPNPLTTPARTFTVQVEPSAWYVGAGGQVSLPGTPAGERSLFLSDINLDSPRLTPFIEVHIRDEDWTFTISGFSYSASDRGTVLTESRNIGSLALNAGDEVSASLDFWSAEAQAGYRFYSGRGNRNFTQAADVIGGVRIYDTDFKVSGPAGSTGEEQFFAHPFIGAKLFLDLVEDFTIDVQADVGYLPNGDGSALGYEILAGFMWRPTEHLAVQIGYRDVAYTLESGSGDHRFSYRGALQGLYAGAVIRF